VAVRFHLKLHPLPAAIMATAFHCRLDDIEAVAGWLAATAPSIPANVELSLFILQAPPELAERSRASNGKACLVTATAFADTEEEGRAALELLRAPPVPTLSDSRPTRTSFEELFDASGAIWPEHQRSTVDAMFYNADPAELARVAGDHLASAPSAATVVLFSLFTGPDVPAPLPDAAFSMSARVYGGPWTMWSEATEDGANIAWHDKCVASLQRLASGHYVSESDTVNHQERARRAYSAVNWERLSQLRAKYDPDGVFFSYSDGLP
jgi:FAD/FMN-containing dehydrogenase